MADFEVSDPRFSPPGTPSVPSRPPRDELPPVEPPSAGFIMQLFVVPALIVLAVVAVWALFGRIASAEQDWRSLVAELRSGNEHRRWRAALGLAQMLKGDQEKGEKGEGLARNPQVCKELTALLEEQLGKTTSRKDDLKQQAFLARTLGFLDLPEVVVPVLVKATDVQNDIDVRRNSLASLALVLGRADERKEHPATSETVDRLIEVTSDPELQIRQLAVYCLGLIPEEAARDHLKWVVDNDSQDATVRANAAVALSRQHSKAGLGYLRTVLKDAAAAKPADTKLYVDSVTIRNAIKSVQTLRGDMTDVERTEVAGLLEPIAAHYPDDRLQLDARAALAEFRQ